MKNNFNSTIHGGLQPVRVLEQNIIHFFENAHPLFLNELKKLVNDSGLNPGISYIVDEKPLFIKDSDGDLNFRSPNVNIEKRIEIQETFLSYLWIICYTLFVVYLEIDPSKNKLNNFHQSKYYKDALNLFKYGISLFNNFSKWDNNLPNPEIYNDEDKLYADYIEKTNAIFLYAVDFVLIHEVSHVKCHHIDFLKNHKNITKEEIKKMEYEADKSATETLIEAMKDKENELTISLGFLSAICSLLLLSKEYTSSTHPDNDERIKISLEQLNIEEKHFLWNIAAVAILLWNDIYKIGLDLNVSPASPKDLFYILYNQMNNLKN